MFRFIHASDIHLGSILHASVKASHKIDEILKEAVYSSFKRICDAAIKCNVKFIILSGDVYDRELSTVKGSRLLYDESKRLEENSIDIYIIRGNHDPLGDGRELFTLSSNVHTFNYEEAEAVEVKRNEEIVARIIGQSYKSKWERRKMISSYNVEDTSVYNIGVVHTALEPNSSNYVPCSIEDLKGKENIHYWALGHIHKCKIINDKKPVIAYCGTPQGRDIGEEGVGGALLIEVREDLSEEIKFIPTSPVVWKKVKLNINECIEEPTGLNDLEELIIEKGEEILNISFQAPEGLESIQSIDNVVEGYIVQWSVEGKGKLNELLREDEENAVKYLMERVNKKLLNRSPFLYSDSVLINTSKEMSDMNYLIKNNQVLKEMDGIAVLCLEDSNLRKDIISTFGSIFEKDGDTEDQDEGKIQLSDDLIEEIISAAKEIVIEKFLEKGEQA